jgi:hypothetical protein
MYGDFARVTFDPRKNRSRVLMQQGRVQLEADWNEQGAIFNYLLRALAQDLIGPEGGPAANCGFQIITRSERDELKDGDERKRALDKMDATDFLVGKGHYYVDGILCVNRKPIAYSAQQALIGPAPDKLALTGPGYLVYLDVVEHSVFAAQDESMLEIALGIETAIRARVSYVVRTVPVTPDANGGCDDVTPSWNDLIQTWQGRNRGWMTCRAGQMEDSTDPCIVSAESRYRGAENQLYRIEVHRGGTIGDGTKAKGSAKSGPAVEDGDRPTFKFSRVNGSAVYKIDSFEEPVVTLADLGLDDRLRLTEGDWVEVLDDTTVLLDKPGPLRRVASVDTYSRQVTLDPLKGGAAAVGQEGSPHPIMRRWDQRQADPGRRGLKLQDGVVPIELNTWIPLEDGIEIRFEAPPDGKGAVVFRAGDYWLAPARVKTGDIIDWPRDDQGEPMAIPPHGVYHHYARLAVLTIHNGQLKVARQCRKSFELEVGIVTKTV